MTPPTTWEPRQPSDKRRDESWPNTPGPLWAGVSRTVDCSAGEPREASVGPRSGRGVNQPGRPSPRPAPITAHRHRDLPERIAPLPADAHPPRWGRGFLATGAGRNPGASEQRPLLDKMRCVPRTSRRRAPWVSSRLRPGSNPGVATTHIHAPAILGYALPRGRRVFTVTGGGRFEG